MENRIETRIEQMLEIVKRYNNPQYSQKADRNSDIFYGSLFVYEILKLGKEIENIRVMFDSYKIDLNKDARDMLDKIIKGGLEEFLDFSITNDITLQLQN